MLILFWIPRSSRGMTAPLQHRISKRFGYTRSDLEEIWSNQEAFDPKNIQVKRADKGKYAVSFIKQNKNFLLSNFDFIRTERIGLQQEQLECYKKFIQQHHEEEISRQQKYQIFLKQDRDDHPNRADEERLATVEYSQGESAKINCLNNLFNIHRM